MRVRTAPRYRRAATLVLYWRRGTFRARNYLTRLETPLTEGVVQMLEQLTDWSTPAEVARKLPSLGPPRGVGRLLDLLARRRLVDRDGDAPAPELGEWTAWHPEAAFFHFATKNGRFRDDPFTYDAELAEKARTTPTPPPTKTIAGVAMPLPRARDLGDLGAALAGRRTWRRFAKTPLAISDLATVLGWTFGVQSRTQVIGQGDFVMKTSPSGGARHPIEAFVVAFRISGVPAGSVHHYDAEGHRLVRVPGGRVVRSDVAAALGHQPYFARAAALVLMAPVFARTMWRYPSSRAYRSVLIEAGHLCQTFCLVATALELAPFSTIGFVENTWERALGLDGIAESPIYIAGVGARPGDGKRAGALPPAWARKVRSS